MNLSKFALAIIAPLALAPVAFAKAEKDIVDTAVENGNFKTLVSLVQKAGLVETLKGKGPFTVLAPTDAAFAKLPKALVDKIVGDKQLLTSILTYHVIAGKVLSTDLKNGLKAKTVQGENLMVSIKGKTVRFNKSKVAIADVLTSNGVIHAIDTVLVPPTVLKALTAKSHH
ncbi:MAG: fasciclin domain-containing protein [Fimbriimonadaceae bacterium]|nr:fasciclin domain-containing protein [Fimbriimonadaceae bacterium]